MKKIAIFGANGRLGREAVKAFSKSGFEVIAITRNGKFLPDKNIKSIACDAMNESQVISATKNCDFILNSLNPLYTKWHILALPMLKNILKAAKINNCVHLFIGNIYNFGSKMPPLLTIDTPQLPDTQKGKIRVEMESLMQDYSKEEVKTIILRSGNFFGGTQVGGGFDMMIARELDKGIVTYPGPLDKTGAWAYLPDLANAFVQLANNAEKFSNFEIFHFEGHSVNGNQMLKSIEKAKGKSFKHKSLPWGFIKLFGVIILMFKAIAEMSYLWEVEHRLDGTKFNKAFPNLKHTEFDEAIRQAIKDLNL